MGTHSVDWTHFSPHNNVSQNLREVMRTHPMEGPPNLHFTILSSDTRYCDAWIHKRPPRCEASTFILEARAPWLGHTWHVSGDLSAYSEN